MTLASLLANADSSDPTQAKFILLLVAAGGVAAVCILVGLVMVTGRRRGSQYAAGFATAAMFWGLVASGSIVYTAATQLMWQQQHFLELLSGYGNPLEAPPALPLRTWSVLALVYVVLLSGTLWNQSPSERAD